MADRINQRHLVLWQDHCDVLEPLVRAGRTGLPSVSDDCVQNAHTFYAELHDVNDHTALINFLREAEIITVFHYIPLHDYPAGDKFGVFAGADRFTTKESERLLHLPLFYNLSPANQRMAISTLLSYFA